MERIRNVIKEWASVIVFATAGLLLLCALIVCMACIATKTMVLLASCGALGCMASVAVCVSEILYDIKKRRAR